MAALIEVGKVVAGVLRWCITLLYVRPSGLVYCVLGWWPRTSREGGRKEKKEGEGERNIRITDERDYFG